MSLRYPHISADEATESEEAGEGPNADNLQDTA